MRKLFFLFVMAAVISCNCLKPQRVSPQTIYAVDSACEAALPNYLPLFSVRDNCPGTIITQDPIAGTMLDASRPYVTVDIIAADISDNRDTVQFQVWFADTIKPTITIDSTLLAEGVFGLLDVFQASLRPYIDDSTWNSSNLVMISSPDYKHMGGWYDKDLHVITASDDDLDKLGYTTYKLYLVDPEPLPLAINAGGPAINEWQEDKFFTQERGGPGATLETADHVYKTERWGEFSYDLPIGNGTFDVELYFAEIYHYEVGDRIFSVHIEDSLVIDQYDILTEAVYGQGITKSFTIQSDFDGYLRIKFSTTIDGAKVSGITIKRTDLVALSN